jgi:adenine phosphoribosyltransferase
VGKMKEYLKLIDTQTRGPRVDVTPLFTDSSAFRALVDDLAEPFKDSQIDLVAGIDALGFILGAAIALHLGVGFLAVRKGGKLPVAAKRVSFEDYTDEKKSLELRLDSNLSGLRVLLVDEWVETGAQMAASVTLIENQGGLVVGIACINIDDNLATQALRGKYICHQVWTAE